MTSPRVEESVSRVAEVYCLIYPVFYKIIMTHGNKQESVTHTQEKGGKRNGLWEDQDVRLSRQRRQHNEYKYAKRIEGNHALRSKGRYDDSISSSGERQYREIIKKEPKRISGVEN